jgi:hypothetical protein
VVVEEEPLVEIGNHLIVVFKEQQIQSVVVEMVIDLVEHHQMVIQDLHLLVQQILVVEVVVVLTVLAQVHQVVKE